MELFCLYKAIQVQHAFLLSFDASLPSGGYTQKGLAEEIGVTESTVRNYELELRMLSEPQLEAIAKALDIVPEALADTGLVGTRGALEMVFGLESEIGFRPVETEDGIGIAVDPKVEGSQKLSQALKAWARCEPTLTPARFRRRNTKPGRHPISRSRVLRLVKSLDEEVDDLRHSSSSFDRWPYLWLDATYIPIREAGHTTKRTVVIAVAVNREAKR